MSVEMQIFYHTINTIVSVFYYVCLILLLSNVVNHKKYLTRTIIIYIGLNIITTIMTETVFPVLIKVYVHMIYLIIMYRFFLSEKTAAVAIHVVYFWLICAMVQENIIIFFCKFSNIVPWVDVGHGVQLGKVRVILTSSLFMFVLTLLLKHILKPLSEVMEHRDLWLLVLSGVFFHGLCESLKQMFYQHEEDMYLIIGIVLMAGIAIIAVLLCIFVYKFLYVDKKEREERIQREVLERQYVYYQERRKDEERVRSIYHDMKNHLLVLEHQIQSPHTAQMVEKLQRELENYADYVNTGNEFLDLIIKDKARIAREKGVDFSAVIDFHGVDFLDPLDISTIFGNGLDNAIEACEKLPDDQRVILVKAGRVQGFLSILMENNCQEESIQKEDKAQRKGNVQNAEKAQGKREAQSTEIAEKMKRACKKKSTSKKDDYLHGFGISNMKQASEKYGGQLTAKSEDGRFTLKIIIPIP